jgi:hypothetical protein
MRRLALAALCGAVLSGLVRPAPAAADQRQDYILAATEKGTYANLDFVFGALQAGVEQRIPVFSGANQLTVRGSGIAAWPFGGGQADVDMRILILTLGMSGGYRSVWRNQTYNLGEPLDRKERRERDASGDFNTDNFGFWDGHASLALPFNDYLVFNGTTQWHITGASKRSFDNDSQVVNDGRFERTDFQLFFKHERFGGLAPMFEVLSFPLDGHWKTQLNYGFMFVTRAGLVRRDDLLVFQMMFHSGPILGAGIDNRDVYGSAVWRGPLTFLLVYRSTIEIGHHEK